VQREDENEFWVIHVREGLQYTNCSKSQLILYLRNCFPQMISSTKPAQVEAFKQFHCDFPKDINIFFKNISESAKQKGFCQKSISSVNQ
jgi:hypothetical protein